MFVENEYEYEYGTCVRAFVICKWLVLKLNAHTIIHISLGRIQHPLTKQILYYAARVCVHYKQLPVDYMALIPQRHY